MKNTVELMYKMEEKKYFLHSTAAYIVTDLTRIYIYRYVVEDGSIYRYESEVIDVLLWAELSVSAAYHRHASGDFCVVYAVALQRRRVPYSVPSGPT
jgi:hypothetical protein